MQKQEADRLRRLAAEIRIETLRGLGTLGFGHIGGSFSIADLLAVLYGKQMNIRPEDPKWEDRDWLVCSKGHAGPAVYAALCVKGYFPKEWMLEINKPGTHRPSHCDRILTPGVDMTTGSLGQGSSAAAGIALGNRMNGKDSYTYLILGDGEIQEGQVWEAMGFIAQQKLSHLIAFVDYNKKQLDGYVRDIIDEANIDERMRAFGLHSVVVDGHDVEAIDAAIEEAKSLQKPACIVLDTVKAKGCVFAEDLFANHSINISAEQMEEGIRALEEEKRRWA